MKEAYKEALKAQIKDEVPIGCVIVKDDKVIARGHNLRETRQQAKNHAEVVAIEKACRKMNSWRLEDCELYVTVEPCMMCMGMIQQARIAKVIYGAKDLKGGCCHTVIDYMSVKGFNHYPEITGGVDEEECSSLISDYFRNKRRNKQGG